MTTYDANFIILKNSPFQALFQKTEKLGMAQKANFKNNNSRRVRKRGEFFSFLVAAILIVGFFAASHYMFFGYAGRKVASITPAATDLKCENLLPLLTSEDENVRFKTTVALASCGYPQAIDGLLGFLNATDLNIQKAAAFALLSQELTLSDQSSVAKIANNRDKIYKLVYPSFSK